MSEPRDPRGTARRDLRLGFVVLAVLAVIAYLSTVALSGGPLRGGHPVRLALPLTGPILRPGAEVRIGGERAGEVQGVDLDRRGRRAIVTLRMDRGTIGAGASARVRLRGMAGAVYVELSPGDAHRPLPAGALVRALPAVQLTDVVATFDRDTRQAMARTLRGFGGGLAGRGTTLSHTLAVAPRALTGATPLLDALAVPGRLRRTLDGFREISDAAAPAGDDALGEVVGGAAATFTTTGARATAIGGALRAAPALEQTTAGVLPDADRLLSRTTVAARELRPALAALAASLPALQRVASRTPQLSAVERLGREALPALRAVAPLVPAVRGPAAGLAAATPSLRELAAYLVPYRQDLIDAPAGFDRWGGFHYDDGQATGHRAVRFSMVFTCATARDPYPAPGAAARDRKACR